jgi:peptide-methionine (R)-S-oxide reductase
MFLSNSPERPAIMGGRGSPMYAPQRKAWQMTDSPSEHSRKVTLSDAEWRRKLTPEQFYVTRKHGTERPGTSPLNREKREGTFRCVCCGEPLFSSADKFESGSGWPSFDQPTSDDVVTRHRDLSLAAERTEVRCARCEAHLGHVFADGPAATTGQRYCINGAALTFKPEPPE